MEYKQTAEYAYDLLMHFYHIHENQIRLVGTDNIKILCPTEILSLLECKNVYNELFLPDKFMKMDLRAYSGSTILFVLKENN